MKQMLSRIPQFAAGKLAKPAVRLASLPARLPPLPRPPLLRLRWPQINWRVVLAALFGIGILHIVATFAAPSLAIATAFDRLSQVLPKNRMVVLPEIAPGSQPLPFLNPALRYAMCRFDTAQRPIDVVANLADTGSSLGIYSPYGETIYAYAATAELRRQHVRLIAPDDRFLGLTPESRGQMAREVPTATIPILTGIAVIAIPDRGHAYRLETQRILEGATCTERRTGA